MKTDDLRSSLIELQRQQEVETQTEAELQQQLLQLTRQVDERQRANVKRRADIVQTRRLLQREEALERAQAELDVMRSQQDALRNEYEKLAQGKPWFEGILEHQMIGAMFGAVAERWILGDEMGLGKTRTSIAWLDLVGARKVIVVAEANVCEQFTGELMELAPHRSITNLYKKTPVRRHELLDSAMSKDEGVIVVNFEIWRRDKDCLAKLLDWQADTLVVDEAHNLKSTATANYKYVQFLIEMDNTCPRCGHNIKGLFMPAEPGSKRRVPRPCPACEWIKGEDTGVEYANPLEDWLKTRSIKNAMFLTGTPILNAPDDIYSMLHLIDPTLFVSRNNFLATYCSSNHHSGKWEFMQAGIDNLKPLIEDRFLARTRQDAGVVLPPQRVHIIPVELDKSEYPKQYKVIRQISERAKVILESGEEMTIMHLIALLTRKRQANVWPGGIEMHDKDGNVIFSVSDEVQESVKMDTIIDHIEVLHEEGHRQVVFSQFKSALAEMERRLSALGYRVVRFDGDTPKHLRTEIKDNFYAAKGETPKWDILLANYKTGGTGLNLTAATKMHILDEEWSPGKRNQAYARVARMGQTEKTDVYVYRIPHTIDTWMANTIVRKQRMIDAFNETMHEDDNVITAESLAKAMASGEIL